MRKPNLTGIYFHAAHTLIDQQITQAFKHKRGPGDLPVKPGKGEGDVKGIIVPQHKYDLAGPCMAWAYKALAESHVPDVIIIIGQSTTSEAGVTIEPYETPYGILRTDQKFIHDLIKRGNIPMNNALFDDDEEIESQLPFVQFTFKSNIEKIKLVPILVTPETKLKELAVDIKETLMDSGKKAAIIVPTNFTSFGRNFGYIPFSDDELNKVADLDKGALELIQANKPMDFLAYIEEHAMNIKNYLGVVMALLITKSHKILLEQYYTTADIDGDHKNFTSFAALVIK